MTALVLAGATAPGAGLPLGAGTVLDAGVERLQRLGSGPTTVVGGDAADLADTLDGVAAALAAATDAVALVSADLVLPDDALADLLLDPRRRTAALVSGRPADSGGVPVRRGAGGRIAAAGSAHHRVTAPDGVFVGAMVVGREDTASAARAVAEMAAVARAQSWSGDPLAHVLVALARRGTGPAAVVVDPWPWWRPATAREVAEAASALAGLDHRAVRLSRALRPDDGFYSTFVVRRLSRRLTPLALRAGLRPNQITLGSLAVGLVAALCFAAGGRTGLVAGAVLLQVSLVVDCVDGEVARYTRAFSATGAWLDASTDRVKEYACYAGLAVGADDGVTRVWLLAAVMLTVQTARHTSDYTYAMVRDAREDTRPDVDLRRQDDAVPPGAGRTLAARAVDAGRRGNRSAALRWAKKVALLPIGERWLVISVAAAVGGPLLVFGSLLVLAVLAAGYATATRLLRSRTWNDRTADQRVREVVLPQLDRGPLLALGGRVVPARVPVGRAAWLLPSLARGAEYAAVLALVGSVAPDALPYAFALLFAVSYHHYDMTYRLLHDLPPAGALRWAGLGVDGRLVVVALLALAGARPLETGLAVLAVLGAVVFGVSGTLGTLVRTASGPRRPPS